MMDLFAFEKQITVSLRFVENKRIGGLDEFAGKWVGPDYLTLKVDGMDEIQRSFSRPHSRPRRRRGQHGRYRYLFHGDKVRLR